VGATIWFGERDSPDLIIRAAGHIGCGLCRGELVALRVDSIQMREKRWVIADLLAKAGHIYTVPIPGWVKATVEEWKDARTRVTGRYPDHRALPWVQAEAALRGQRSDWHRAHRARRYQVISKRQGL